MSWVLPRSALLPCRAPPLKQLPLWVSLVLLTHVLDHRNPPPPLCPLPTHYSLIPALLLFNFVLSVFSITYPFGVLSARRKKKSPQLMQTSDMLPK
jgi:hypothetical protein